MSIRTPAQPAYNPMENVDAVIAKLVAERKAADEEQAKLNDLKAEEEEFTQIVERAQQVLAKGDWGTLKACLLSLNVRMIKRPDLAHGRHSDTVRQLGLNPDPMHDIKGIDMVVSDHQFALNLQAEDFESKWQAQEASISKSIRDPLNLGTHPVMKPLSIETFPLTLNPIVEDPPVQKVPTLSFGDSFQLNGQKYTLMNPKSVYMYNQVYTGVSSSQ